MTNSKLKQLVDLLEQRVGTPATGYYGSVNVDSVLIDLVNSARPELNHLSQFKRRMDWLHSGSTKDAEGYEWGVARVKFDSRGQPMEILWTLSDHSDLDMEMKKTS